MLLWVGPEIQKVLLKTIATRESWRNDAKKADKFISHCTECNKCWEIIIYSTGNKGARRKKMIAYYKNFVTYGKPKKVCPRCK